jgi:hypothetical protein
MQLLPKTNILHLHDYTYTETGKGQLPCDLTLSSPVVTVWTSCFDIKKLCIVNLCVSHSRTEIISLNNINQSAFIMYSKCLIWTKR